jgi:hypothetical protein
MVDQGHQALAVAMRVALILDKYLKYGTNNAHPAFYRPPRIFDIMAQKGAFRAH